MFIYSYYAHHGFESPQRLVKAISDENIKEICLIDEKGMAIPSFLHSCLEKNINVSFAISFRSFIEGMEGKQDGYLITGEKEGLEWVMKTVGELKEKYIPYLNEEEIGQLKKRNVYCFLKKDIDYQEITTKKEMVIKPVYFVKEEDKKSYELFFGQKECYTVESDRLESDSFIQEIATDPKDFLKIESFVKKKMDVFDQINWVEFSKKEKRQIRREWEYFKEENGVVILHSLAKAKKEGIQFYAHGDFYKSYLAYSLGIVPMKPEKIVRFDHAFDYSIVISKMEQTKLFRLLEGELEVKYPLAKYELKPKKALRKAQEILGEYSEMAIQMKEDETLDAFMDRMRVRLLVNEKEQKIFHFACYLSKMKEEKCTLKKNYILFMPEMNHLVKDEEIVYVDVENLDILSIPYIRCFYPYKK